MPRKKNLTEEQLRQCHKMAALNMPFEYMAALIGIQYDYFIRLIKTSKTLRTAIQEGRGSANNNVRVTLLEKAMGKPPITDVAGKVLYPAIEPDFQALKFWCETQEGFKKTSILEVPGLSREDTQGMRNDDLEGRANALMEKLQKRLKKTKK